MNALRQFLQLEAAGGIILLIAAVLALICTNSDLAPLYRGVLTLPFGVTLGPLGLVKPLLLWINDGLMAVFFFLVGLEIKREILGGELSTPSQAALPSIAALGGMVVPALVYFLINRQAPEYLGGWAIPAATDIAFALAVLALPSIAALGGMVVPALVYFLINRQAPEYLGGWAIPAATDIAFALAVLALLGNRVPPSLKIFLLALAIIDDLGAIIIIAIFYTADLSVMSLSLAGLGGIGLLILNRTGVQRITPYVLIGIFIWVCVLKSGVHATLAGVAVALFVPYRIGGDPEQSPLRRAEHGLHPWVSYGVMPIFAFANAGVNLSDLSLQSLSHSLTLGIALGLFVGKQVGVLAAVAIGVMLGLCKRPTGASWMQIYGVALLTGIGFTMSLFIGGLAFPDTSTAAEVRLGVLTGTCASAVLGYLVLRFFARPAPVSAAETS